MAQDSRGDLWFAAKGGIYRYDGDTWSLFTITNALNGGVPGSMNVKILPDARGGVWFLCQAGICRYDGPQSARMDSRENQQ